MNTFKRLAALLVLALLLVPGVGCGGSGGHQESTVPKKNQLGASTGPAGQGAPKGQAGNMSQ